MRAKKTTPANVEQALNALGVFGRRAMRRISPNVEFLEVPKGHRVVRRGVYHPWTVIGVSGVVIATGDAGPAPIKAPFVLGPWMNEDFLAGYDIVAAADATVLVTDPRHRESVLASIPDADVHEARTVVQLTARQSVIDLREPQSSSERIAS